MKREFSKKGGRGKPEENFARKGDGQKIYQNKEKIGVVVEEEGPLKGGAIPNATRMQPRRKEPLKKKS